MSILESYEAERADFERVLDGVRAILAAPLCDLQSVEWLADRIREVGLVPIPESERTYGKDAEYLNSSQQGVIQLPEEFAAFLHLLGRYSPASYLEIGTFNGATASLATAYLQRFNPAIQTVTIDIYPAFIFYEETRTLLPNLRYEVGKTSFDFRSQRFDAVFIDGDHSFEWAWADYRNTGIQARFCAIHDVNNAPYRELPTGGVPAVWELVKQTEPTAEFQEIFKHPEEDLLGIGVRIKADV